MITLNAVTYDLKFDSFYDARDFIIGISGAVRLSNQKFAGLTNKSMITNLLLRSKLKFIARQKKTTVAGLLARALYLSVAQTCPEDTFYEIKTKYELMTVMQGKCLILSSKLSDEDRSTQDRLASYIEQSLGIDL